MPHPFSLWLYSPFFTKKEQGLKNFQLYLAFACFWIKLSFISNIKAQNEKRLRHFLGVNDFLNGGQVQKSQFLLPLHALNVP
ncbi:hypothetical protein CV724_01330 [Helicobacter pylori]|nr:hypothetical protein CV724_01330 [Helicobacter pylori]